MRRAESEVRRARPGWRRLARTAAFPLFVSIVALLMASSDWRRQQRLTQVARPIQAELDLYRGLGMHQQYPDSLAQIGFVENEEGPISDECAVEHGWILWLGPYPGEPKTLHTGIGVWR